MMPRSFPRSLLVAAAGLLLTAMSAGAQVVTGRVTDRANGGPVTAVLVELLTLDSTRVRATLSGVDGRYNLVALAPGNYLVRADRLGYQQITVGPLEVAGTTTRDIVIEPQPFRFEPIEATGVGQCQVRPDEGARTAALWEQIRKVLAVASVAQEERLLEFELIRYTRELDRERTRLAWEEATRWTGSDPFAGLPGEVLARDGYVQPEADGHIGWYGPDPGVFLSDGFLGTHCFRTLERTQNGRRLLGLSFRPLEGRRKGEALRRRNRNEVFEELVSRDGADITGVLWVDAQTAALESLEYSYDGIRSDELRRMAGGWARFEQLANGMWVTRQWLIRIPTYDVQYARLRGIRRLAPTGLREAGGELIEARTPDGHATTRRAGWKLTGRVVASDLALPFDQLQVRLAGTTHVAQVAADSTFAFDDLPAGRYLAMLQHPKIDTLGIDRPVHAVEIDDAPATRDVSVPSVADVMAEACRGRRMRPDRGVLLVAVRLANGRPMPESEVRIRTVSELELREIAKEETDKDGRVRFCELPAGQTLEVTMPDQPSVRGVLTVAPGGFARFDVVVPLPALRPPGRQAR